jgi:hypothetical protein
MRESAMSPRRQDLDLCGERDERILVGDRGFSPQLLQASGRQAQRRPVQLREARQRPCSKPVGLIAFRAISWQTAKCALQGSSPGCEGPGGQAIARRECASVLGRDRVIYILDGRNRRANGHIARGLPWPVLSGDPACSGRARPSGVSDKRLPRYATATPGAVNDPRSN